MSRTVKEMLKICLESSNKFNSPEFETGFMTGAYFIFKEMWDLMANEEIPDDEGEDFLASWKEELEDYFNEN